PDREHREGRRRRAVEQRRRNHHRHRTGADRHGGDGVEIWEGLRLDLEPFPLDRIAANVEMDRYESTARVDEGVALELHDAGIVRVGAARIASATFRL